MNRDAVLFHEEQRFRQRGLVATMILLPLLMIGVFGWGMVQQLLMKQPWGQHPLSDQGLLVAGSASIAITVAVSVLVLFIRLRTNVFADRIEVALGPLAKRSIPLKEIRSAKAETYRPIREFGGWGYRIRYGKRAFNAMGNRGVRLLLADGPEIMIGSQRAEELEAAIRDAKEQRR